MTSRPPLTPLFALLLIRGIASFQLQAAAVAAPSLIGDLKLTYAQVGLAMGAFLLPGIFLTVPAGWMARRVGDRVQRVGGGHGQAWRYRWRHGGCRGAPLWAAAGCRRLSIGHAMS